MADIAMSAMVIDASLDGTERMLAQGADGSIILVSGLSSYIIDELVGAAAITPTTGDALVVERSGAEGTFDLDALASYVIATGWGIASEADPAVSGDMILANRSGTIVELDVDTIIDLVDVQADVLDLSGLANAVLADADYVLICQTSTATKTTLAALYSATIDELNTYVIAFETVASCADTDELYLAYNAATTPLNRTITAGDLVRSTTTQLQGAKAVIADDDSILTTGNLESRILTMASSAADRIPTVPTGTLMNAAIDTGQCLDWTFINTGVKLVTVTAATGHTLVGDMTLVAGESGAFRTRVSASNTAITYRLDGSTAINLSTQRLINCEAKIGTTAGWTLGAANLGTMALLPASQASSTLVVPINGLRVGDTITAFSVVGQIESDGNTATLDADLRKLTVVVAAVTDASVGAIDQISVTADTAVSNSKTGLTEVVAADEMFYVLLTGTTAALTDIDLIGLTITVTEKLSG